MSLKKKTLFFFFAVMAAIAITLFASTLVFTIHYFNQLEQATLEADLNHITSDITQELSALHTTAVDYAVWDDAHEFMRDHNPNFIDENLSTENLSQLNINLWLMTDSNGKIVAQKSYMEEGLSAQQDTKKITSDLQTQVINEVNNQTPSLSGIFRSGNQFYLISSHIIQSSNEQGESNGVLTLGRMLNQKELAKSVTIANASVALLPFDSEQLSSVSRSLAEEKNGFTRIKSGNLLEGYSPLYGVQGEPVAVLQLSAPRQIYNTGLKSTLYALGLVFVVGWIGALLIVRFFNKNIFTPLNKLGTIAESIAVGNFSIEIPQGRKDEIGKVYGSLSEMKNYLVSLSDTTARIAAGDLTSTVLARSDTDTLTQSTNTMVSRLRQTVQTLIQSIQQLNSTSQKLVDSAAHAGQATSQITTTIQQVAHGTSQQSESVNRTAQSMEQMVRVITGVAQGANEQAQAVTHASEATSSLSQVIEKVNQSALQMVARSTDAVETTQKSTQIVQSTLNGMQQIKNSVLESGQRVDDMGNRSEEIGDIVTTIEEIASQTNLLALNAAIEAARAETQANQLTEHVLNRQMISQARMVDTLLSKMGDNIPANFWQELATFCKLDTVIVTDADGVICMCNDTSLIGFRFSDDPKEQSYAFRKLLHEKDGIVTQPPQKRSADARVFKFVGVSRSAQPGIIQVAFDANSLASFQLQVGGFSVVADEVYRLAENAKNSAKNIAVLVKQIDKSVQEANRSMDHSTRLVDEGVEQAGQAQLALSEIMAVLQNVSSQATEVQKAAADMSASTSQLIEAVDSVSAIVEENTAATEEMAANASEVSMSVENIASVSEENSAAVQEVSASSEEMNDQVQAVSQSTLELAELSAQLQSLVDQFKF